MNDSNFAIRLKLFMDAIGISSSQLADRCGVPRPSMSSILSGRNKKISDTLIGQIHAVFPQLNVLWLMCGEGEMFLPSSGNNGSHNADIAVDSSMSESVIIDDEFSNPGSEGSERFSGTRGGSSNNFAGVDGTVSGRESLSGAEGFVPSSSVRASEGLNRGSQNVELSNEGKGMRSQSILNGLDSPDLSASDRMNKGFDDDLRTIALMRQIENMKANPRKVTQITIYYDDSTFETFKPS